MKGSAILWIILFGAALFFAGFFLNNFITGTSDPSSSPTYLERLTELLNLSENQQDKVRGLLDEMDRQVKQVLQSKESTAIRDNIGGIRKGTQEKILEVLEPSQRVQLEKFGLEEDLKEAAQNSGTDDLPDYDL